MISQKMMSFLTNKCGIENFEDFDFKFGTISKNSKTNVFRMEIVKETPWNFSLLDFFIEHWPSSEYELTFAYTSAITSKHVLDLFKEMFVSKYFRTPNATFDIQDNVILFDSDNDSAKITKLIVDFEFILKQVNYPRFRIINSKNENIEVLQQNLNIEQENIEVLQGFSNLEEEEIPSEFDDFDFEKEMDDIMYEESDSMLKESKRMEERLVGLDNSRRYQDLPISELTSDNINVVCDAEIFSIETKDMRNGRKRYIFGFADKNENAIFGTVIEGKEFSNEYLSTFKVHDLITFTGYTMYDKFLSNDIVVKLTSMILRGKKELRVDNAPQKRVELHLHTKMSQMDGVTDIADYAKLAKSMGHKAIAITDHGVVQGFPAAQKAAKTYGIKMLYGAELYVVNDEFTPVINPNEEKLTEATYCVLDFESTGLSTRYDKIIEFGAVRMKNGIILDRIDLLINPGHKLSKEIVRITGIDDSMLRGKPTIDVAIDQIMEFIGDSIIVSHNLEFDYGLLKTALKETRGVDLVNPGVDTLDLSRYLNPEVLSHKLGSLCRRNEIMYDEDAAHRADYDAVVLTKCWVAMIANLSNRGFSTIESISRLKKETSHIKHSYEMHTTVLAKNKEGLKALYKLISLSHIQYLGRYPCVPKSKLIELRENLIIGSACSNGEVFDVASRLDEKELDRVVEFYDFIEIQPYPNYSLYIDLGTAVVRGKERLDRTLNDIIKSAKKLGKIICATGDVHYRDPEDHKYREVYVYTAGVGKTSHPLYAMVGRKDLAEKKNIFLDNPKQHFRSTDEMLEEFKMYGEENAYEWVVTNTNKIADMCEEIIPIPSELFTPTIDNCENLLRELCYTNAHKLYGDKLPELIENRLERELNGIINNGFSVIYYIAHLIIKKTHEDGYIVGSRGSVGSSFVATMANITEVNPLPPHYRCPKCRHFELSDDPKYRSGYDLPVKKCPICGENMIGDGQNIPFETFLGFDADKVPDIDLNFPPDYQAKAHDYTKVLLGEQNVFRAGTIGTVADKTAFGNCKKYLMKRFGFDPNYIPKAKILYLVSGCTDVKRTTGQHPGGIVVIPRDFEVYDFTPIQYPADDMDASWMTTHLDFHAIHDTVLKLDLLGHVDPQALKFMCDQLGVNYLSIPLSDKKVFSLFSSPNALNLKENYLKLKNGALAIPEFGTDFVRGLLDQTKPSSFADLLIISGLSHGTNVWRNNADELIASGITDLRGVIGCRDDIMTYLISMGVDPLKSFTLMEKIRKGKGLTIEEEDLLRSNNVPDYYIQSCKKIAYLFPKAHATAYVTMAIRVGWFKVYHPLIFYAGFFSVRCDKYEWAPMVGGPEAILKRLKELEILKREHPNDYSKKYEEIEKTLTVALEMYDRGIKFAKLDLYRSDDKNFIIDEETNSLIPPFKVIDGLGEAAAENIIKSREGGPFTSIEDFEKRSKINQTLLETFKELGVFDGLSAKDIEQISLFDFM